jgi:hypothetical protein
MNTIRDIILKLKEVKAEKGYSYNEIVALLEKNGDYISRSTVQRVFSEGSEDISFRYEETIRPIAKALLDIENIEDDDVVDVQAMKVLLKYKIQRIEELEQQLDKEKLKTNEKLERERERANRSIDFLKDQVRKKDDRIDLLLDAVKEKDDLYKQLIQHIMNCPYRQCEVDK